MKSLNPLFFCLLVIVCFFFFIGQSISGVRLVRELSSVKPKGRTVWGILDGGPSKAKNYEEFHREVKSLYKTLRKEGKEVKVCAKDKSWKLNYTITRGAKKKAPTSPPISHPAKSKQDIINFIKSFDLKPGDTFALAITGHGGPPKTKDPSSATIYLWGKEITFKELEDIVSEFDTKIKFKITAAQCYSGGVHHLSRELPNVCSTSSVRYNETSKVHVGYSHPHMRNLVAGIYSGRGQGSLTFGDLGVHSIKTNKLQFTGTLSSEDYVDFVLKRGAYQKQSKKKKETAPILGGSSRGDKNCGRYFLLVSKTVSMFEKLYNLSSDIVAHTLKSMASILPENYASWFNRDINMIRKHENLYMEKASKFQKEMDKLEEKWLVSLEKYKKAGKSVKDIGRARVREFSEKKKELVIEFREDLSSFWHARKSMMRLQRIHSFLKTATSDQKRKYKQLLRCEWEEL